MPVYHDGSAPYWKGGDKASFEAAKDKSAWWVDDNNFDDPSYTHRWIDLSGTGTITFGFTDVHGRAWKYEYDIGDGVIRLYTSDGRLNYPWNEEDSWRAPEEGEEPLAHRATPLEEASPYEVQEAPPDVLGPQPYEEAPPDEVNAPPPYEIQETPPPIVGNAPPPYEEDLPLDPIPELIAEPAPPAPEPTDEAGPTFLTDDEQRRAEEMDRAEQERNPDPPEQPPADPGPSAETPVGPGGDRQPPEETPGPSFEDLGIRARPPDYLNLPNLVEEPAPTPPAPPEPEIAVVKPKIDPDLLNPKAEGPTLDPDLFDAEARGPTIDPALVDPNAEGPTIDPALLDPAARGPTIDPSLLDPTSPGPTVDPNTLDPAAPGPTVDPATLDPTFAEPSAVLDPALTAPALADPALTDPSLAPPPPTTTAPTLDDPVVP